MMLEGEPSGPHDRKAALARMYPSQRISPFLASSFHIGNASPMQNDFITGNRTRGVNHSLGELHHGIRFHTDRDAPWFY
jgi:hypothetical protein